MGLQGSPQRRARREKLINDFTYHKSQGDQQERYQALRAKGLELALLAFDSTPESFEQEMGHWLLNMAVMSFNASIARNE